MAGIRTAGTLIYSCSQGEVPEGLSLLPATTRVMRVDAQTIAIEEKSRPNAVLIGTLTAALPFLERQAMLDTLEATFAGHHREAVAALSSSPVWGYRTAHIDAGLTPAKVPRGNKQSWSIAGLYLDMSGYVKIIYPNGCYQDQFKS